MNPWIFLAYLIGSIAVIVVQEIRLRLRDENDRLREARHTRERKALGDKLVLYTQVRDAAVALDLAQGAYALGRNDVGQAELLFSVRRAERAVIESALEVIESSLTFGEALVVARMGKCIGRRSKPSMILRWSADALEMRAPPSPGSTLGPTWIDYEPTEEDRAATDWIRRTLGAVILAFPIGTSSTRGRVLS